MSTGDEKDSIKITKVIFKPNMYENEKAYSEMMHLIFL